MQTALSLFLGKEVGSKDGHDKQIKGKFDWDTSYKSSF